MSRFLIWYLLSSLTGSPVLSALALIAFWWATDRFTFRILPDPLRMVGRWRRAGASAHVRRGGGRHRARREQHRGAGARRRRGSGARRGDARRRAVKGAPRSSPLRSQHGIARLRAPFRQP